MRAGPERRHGWPLLLLAILPCMLLPARADAQYFGRNKVQYKNFDFQVLGTPHFDVYFYEEEREAARLAARMAERWYSRFAGLLDYRLTGKQPLILYASHPEFAQTTVIPGDIGEATGGVTEAFKRRIVLPMEGAVRATDHVIGHELVHAFQYDLSGISPSQPLFAAPAISGLPLWAVEGLAEYLSIGPRSSLTAMWMRDGVQHNRLPSLGDLANPYEYFPYRWGHALWAYIGGRYGDGKVWDLFRTAVARRGIEVAIDSVLRVHPDTLVAQWHRALVEQYAPLQSRAALAGATGRLLTGKDEGALDIAPALSPDGKRLLYLSSRDPYSIDLYLADAATGEVKERLTESALDPHYESLQFVNSAGAWASDNERIAFTASSGGRPTLVLMRASSGDRIKTFALDRFSAVFNPAWSPDGSRIAFVANQGGFLDLWIVQVESGALRRLTNDQHAELHPAWSPDGQAIAITTDRFGEGYALALIDPSSGAVREVPTFEGVTSLNPQWGPDSRTLFFVSNPDGIPNVYQVSVSGGAPAALTRLFTGVSGLTELSPALAVASGTGDIVFTAYENNGHRLYRLNHPRALAEGAAMEGIDAAQLPPANRRLAGIWEMLARPSALPDGAGYTTRDYDSGIALDYVAPPTLGFAIGGYGSFIGGGVAFGFSDMLGFHELGLQLQAQIVGGEVLNGIGAELTYINRRNRLNWGVTAGQTPQLFQAFGQTIVDTDNDGREEVLQQTARFWNVSRHAIALMQYPFSTSTRLELSGGFERLSFDAETENLLFDPFTGEELDRSAQEAPECGDSLSVRQRLCRPAAMNLFRGSAALVHDRSLMGPTGPIGGTRYRLEVSPSFGTLDYMGVLGDLRGYLRIA
ncbi:MAG TPA: hypothetical protein VFO95_01080, partial [Gemmatimonadales bacterium]|nr:hypothetical protein [Gemmatimonadales bacterium]